MSVGEGHEGTLIDGSPAGAILNTRRQAINSFKALMRVKPPQSQKYCVFAYFLVDPPTDPNIPYDPVGMYIILGSYKRRS